MNEITTTVFGNVATEPRHAITPAGVARTRLPRRLDRRPLRPRACRGGSTPAPPGSPSSAGAGWR
nr:hypothetical protein [Angustibacter aerolatus]